MISLPNTEHIILIIIFIINISVLQSVDATKTVFMAWALIWVKSSRQTCF